jgi:hypothetical protein
MSSNAHIIEVDMVMLHIMFMPDMIHISTIGLAYSSDVRTINEEIHDLDVMSLLIWRSIISLTAKLVLEYVEFSIIKLVVQQWFEAVTYCSLNITQEI